MEKGYSVDYSEEPSDDPSNDWIVSDDSDDSDDSKELTLPSEEVFLKMREELEKRAKRPTQTMAEAMQRFASAFKNADDSDDSDDSDDYVEEAIAVFSEEGPEAFMVWLKDLIQNDPEMAARIKEPITSTFLKARDALTALTKKGGARRRRSKRRKSRKTRRKSRKTRRSAHSKLDDTVENAHSKLDTVEALLAEAEALAKSLISQ